MAANPKLTLLLLLSITAGLGQSAVVTQGDEDRAIGSIMQLLRQGRGPNSIQNVRTRCLCKFAFVCSLLFH